MVLFVLLKLQKIVNSYHLLLGYHNTHIHIVDTKLKGSFKNPPFISLTGYTYGQSSNKFIFELVTILALDAESGSIPA